ncbi:uncharacterized protein LOC101853653 [Aplysia californica]|uniref:Uncharacterized protein LOC101853653 n=1 Tax=Aplysia californica TaxID=6500 RepID=A0ABM1A3W8_APLCA|nr:uncharacterized protein LOC101853653 [Aplysia californica]
MKQLNLALSLTIGLLFIVDIVPISFALKGCSFRHRGCTYNIQLNHKDHEIESRNEGCREKNEEITLDRAQNDYTAKIDDMEKNFSFLRDAHEQRIKELESTVRDLLGIGKSGEFVARDKDGVEISRGSTTHLSSGFSINNKELMDKLETEFNKLREAVRSKSTELIDTQIKLNETSVAMHEAQLKHFKTSQDLLNTENQVTMLKRERAVLKNQLKDRSYKLDVSTSKAKDCELKSTDQQDRMMELFRSESTLKEELMTVQLTMNMTKNEMAALQTKHRALRGRHERVRSIMKIREQELINCYSAKTSTFCGFEDPNICGFININDTSDFFDWTRGKGRTPSANTGPSKDHTCRGPSGHFMFIEASAKGRGSNAILYSPLYRGMQAQCVEFFYHMNGRHIGTLNVYAQARGDVLNSAWRAYGNQGDVWTNARLAIPRELAMAGYQLAFEGITENGYQGDMAIDDVSVTDGPCPMDETVVPVKVKVNSTTVIKEGKSFARKLRRKRKRLS